MVSGLSKFLNLNLSLSTAFPVTPSFFFNTSGIYASDARVLLTFDVVNQTNIVASTFGVCVDLSLDLKPFLTLANGKLILNTTIISHSSVVTTTFTNVGPVQTQGFSQLVYLVSLIKIPGISLPIPSSLHISNPLLSLSTNYLQVGMNYNIPSQDSPNLTFSAKLNWKNFTESTSPNLKGVKTVKMPISKVPLPNKKSQAVQVCGDGSENNCPQGVKNLFFLKFAFLEVLFQFRCFPNKQSSSLQTIFPYYKLF